MENEVSKYGKKIYHHLKNPSYTVSQKAKDIVIEIVIIVFAVTLSIWLHNWSLHRHQQKEVRIFLINLKEDLKKDSINLSTGKQQYSRITDEYIRLLEIKPSQFDSLEKIGSKISFHVQLQGKQIIDGNYESFKTSGKLSYIENEKLKQLILLYYQKNLQAILVIDDYYRQFLFKVLEIKIENAGKTDRDVFSNPKLREAINYLILIGKNNIRNYEDLGLIKVRDLIEEIENELKK